MPSRSRRSCWRTRAWAGLSDMAGDETIGEAVRQLGRAVGSLARALVGTVRRGRGATTRREPESGPPQAWLDLVAETDPEWLARSRWADRAARPGRERRRQRGGRAASATPAPAAEPAPHPETRTTDTPSPSNRRRDAVVEPAQSFERPATRADVVTDGGARSAGGTVREVGHSHLVPAEPAQVRALHVDALAPEASRSPRLVPVQESRAAADREVPTDETVRRTSPLLDAPAPPDLHPETEPFQVPSSPGVVRPSSYSPLSAHVRELPGTWLSQPTPEPRRPASPPSPPAPTWPQLPPTEGLEDQSSAPRPGLVAVLWDLDGRPDTLTIAQRRS